MPEISTMWTNDNSEIEISDSAIQLSFDCEVLSDCPLEGEAACKGEWGDCADEEVVVEGMEGHLFVQVIRCWVMRPWNREVGKGLLFHLEIQQV